MLLVGWVVPFPSLTAAPLSDARKVSIYPHRKERENCRTLDERPASKTSAASARNTHVVLMKPERVWRAICTCRAPLLYSICSYLDWKMCTLQLLSLDARLRCGCGGEVARTPGSEDG